MIKDEEGKILRNLQEQVLYLSQEIEKFKGGSIKISYWVAASTDLPALMVDGNEGKFVVVGSTNPQHLYVLTKRANNGWIADNLGEYPAVVTGPQGQAGANGAQGERGFSIYGVTSQLPSAEAYQNGDMYITYDGNLYKKVNGSWLLQRNFKGPQGPIGPGGGTEVVANPEETSTEDLTKIKIDGTVYNVKGLTSAQAEWIAKALVNTTWDSNGNFTVIKNLTVDMSVFADEVSAAAVNTDVIEARTSGGDVEFGSDVDMGGYAIDNASEISAGGSSQTTGLVANFHGDAQVHGDLIVDAIDNIVDTNGDQVASKVSGTNDGTNWTSLTVDGTTKAIPQGGGGGGGTQLYLHKINEDSSYDFYYELVMNISTSMTGKNIKQYAGNIISINNVAGVGGPVGLQYANAWIGQIASYYAALHGIGPDWDGNTQVGTHVCSTSIYEDTVEQL